MTVVENLRSFGYTLAATGSASTAAIDDCFEAFPRLAERRNSLAATLSGGEQQMLGLSKALILRPRLLLIDELSLGLAPVIVGQLLDMVRRINADGTAVVLVEQSVNIALNLVDHAYFMEKGEMRFDGPRRASCSTATTCCAPCSSRAPVAGAMRRRQAPRDPCSSRPSLAPSSLATCCAHCSPTTASSRRDTAARRRARHDHG